LAWGYVFKASFDKANRTSVENFRGPGLTKGLEILHQVKSKLDVPVVTDIHEPGHVAEVGEVADILQIPAFLCRQTDLLVAAGNTGKVVNIKKGQFLAPGQIEPAIRKVQSTGADRIMVTERGTTFGYSNLVVDMRGLPIMRELGVPVVFDATHSVQLPGGRGSSSGGQREYAPALIRAALAVGIDSLFMEVHPAPENALCDGPNSLPLAEVESVLIKGKAIHELIRST
jgi:2-dehydro-3-deoxyphosphooctonate aldolase (KDO 8-P synthase)